MHLCRCKGILFLLTMLNLGMQTYAQETQNDSISILFDQIDELIEHKAKYPKEFLEVDYLKAALVNSKDKDKVRLLLLLHTAYVFRSWDIAKKYNDEALQLSRTLDFKEGELRADYNSAYLSFVKGDFNEAIRLALAVRQELEPKIYPEIYADITTLESDINTEKGQYDVALESGLRLLDMGERTKNDYMLMKANAALSHYYLRIGNYSKSRSYCLKGMTYIIKLKRTEYIYPKINELARMTTKLEGPADALEIYTFFFEVEKKIPAPGDYIKSITYMIMADIYMGLQDLNMAQDYLSRAMEMNYANDYRFRIPRALTQQAELYLKANDTVNAILSYEKSIEAAEYINAFDVVKSNSAILGLLYEKTLQFAKSFEYKTIYSAIRDSLFTNEQQQRINILEARRRIKEVTRQKQILELKNEAQRSRYKTIAILLGCLLFLTVLTLYGYFKVKGKNMLLYQRTIELTKVQLDMKEKLDVFQNSGIRDPKVVKATKPSESNQKIDSDVKDIILGRLDKLENEAFFLDSNCNLHQLAEQLKTNPKYLSQVINQEKKLNFNNYINELRMNYLLPKLLTDKEFRNSKLMYIAVSVGYNNQNTFNTAFKKRFGILPSYFIDQLNNESMEEVQTEDDMPSSP